MIKRARRLRGNKRIRAMVRETRFGKDSLIYPIFIAEGKDIYEEIKAMPGQYRYSTDKCKIILEKLLKAGVYNIMLFGIPEHKDEVGSSAYAKEGVVQEAIRYIKREYLAKISLSHAQAGADMVAPSDMMDGRVAHIRQCLDENGYENIPIMAYSAKYASSFYGPFREAAGSAPSFGDRKSYQMDFANAREALKEIKEDISEGADIIMVKPAMSYLDIVTKAKEICDIPVAAYSVSGEYAMVKAGERLGYINADNIIKEMAVAAFRAGADIYITYFALEIADFIKKGEL